MPGSNYETNMYHYLKRMGYDKKYEHPGIYCIRIDNLLVYVGKSQNMLRRVAEHYVGIQRQLEHKYKIIAAAGQRGHTINFDVLYYAKAKSRKSIISEIGIKEGEYIRELRPLLNTQIPKQEDWHKYDYNADAASITLDDILKEIGK